MIKLTIIGSTLIIIITKNNFPVLRKAFSMFDPGKTGFIEKEKIRTILNTLGAQYVSDELEALLEEYDPESECLYIFYGI